MPRTSAQLYADIAAVNEGDRDPLTSQILLKKLALSAANIAAGLETISLFNGAPVNAITAASLYTAVEAVNENDKDVVTQNELYQLLGQIFAKIAMETESIRTGMGPQDFVESHAGSVTLSASCTNAESFVESHSGSVALSAECTIA